MSHAKKCKKHRKEKIVKSFSQLPGYLLWRQLVLSFGEGNGNPLQCSCLENPRDGRAWWAAVYRVAQSRTRLKRLSNSSSGSAFFSCTFVSRQSRNKFMFVCVCVYNIHIPNFRRILAACSFHLIL